MESILIAAVIIGIGWWAYKNGKQIGSRKGYNVGHARRSRRHRHRRRR